MDAITLLKDQHNLVEDLFEQFENTEDEENKLILFSQIADNLAIHAIIEERWFYPSVRARQTEAHIEEAYDEHLEIKELVLDCIHSTEAPGFDGKVAALKGAVLHHVEEEEENVFPAAKKLLTKDALEALGQTMEGETATMEEAGNARLLIKPEIEPPSVQP